MSYIEIVHSIVRGIEQYKLNLNKNFLVFVMIADIVICRPDVAGL